MCDDDDGGEFSAIYNEGKWSWLRSYHQVEPMEEVDDVDRQLRSEEGTDIPPIESSQAAIVDQDAKREKMFQKRALVASEIVSSEATYLNRLRVTADVFMTPFRYKIDS